MSDDRQPPEWMPDLLARIESLRTLIPQAIEDGERETPIRERSVENAIAFATRLGDVARPGAFIQHDGLARLVWMSGKVEGVRHFTEQVAIKFRENHLVEFVLFREEKGEIGTSDIMGIAHVDAILGIVSDLGLDHVMRSR